MLTSTGAVRSGQPKGARFGSLIRAAFDVGLMGGESALARAAELSPGSAAATFDPPDWGLGSVRACRHQSLWPWRTGWPLPRRAALALVAAPLLVPPPPPQHGPQPSLLLRAAASLGGGPQLPRSKVPRPAAPRAQPQSPSFVASGKLLIACCSALSVGGCDEESRTGVGSPRSRSCFCRATALDWCLASDSARAASRLVSRTCTSSGRSASG